MRSNEYWQPSEAILRTGPYDVGCDATMEMPDVYAELVVTGADAAEHFPKYAPI
ncbi:hypothetical protein [Cumulibacter soli]|uniref:hypothetical protein n=1 Tax=Cumulibacter soli TaxID=2546344 RepID=UPI001ABBCE84|nr:hypothetical protein [Cumulibacter soli]